jgi:predicted nucleic acid-binding protein
MNSRVCVDASTFIKLLIFEELTPQARSLWEFWAEHETVIIVPFLFFFEVTAVLRKKVYRGFITPLEGEAALEEALEADVELLSPSGLHRRAWELATHLNRPTAYDAHYLALAEMFDCQFWTADQRLYNSVKNELHWVSWLGDFQPPSVPSTSATMRS